jgi:hypothetical protein
MKDLLPVHEQGIVRTSAVQIGASHYTPLADPGRLRTEMKCVLPEARHYFDPFEQGIYLHCNLAVAVHPPLASRLVPQATLEKCGLTHYANRAPATSLITV